MLNRRGFLKVTVASAVATATGIGVAAAAPGKLVGHSMTSLSHVLHGIVPMEDVQAIYLTPMMLGKVQRMYSYSRRYEVIDGKIIGWSKLGFLASAEQMERLPAMWMDGFIVARPESMGQVGRLVWTRDGEPYEPPALHGGRVEWAKPITRCS